MEQNINTDGLLNILKSTPPEAVGEVIRENQDALFSDAKPFAGYIRELLEKHGKTQRDVIEKAGFSMKYGYRLLSEERHTKQRDYILRLCIAAALDLEETQRILKLYGMSPLYAKLPRDAVLISCIGSGGCSVEQINQILCTNDQPILTAGSEIE